MRQIICKLILLVYGLIIFLFSSCKKVENDIIITQQPLLIVAADMAALPIIKASGIVAKNNTGVAEDMLTTLKNSGVNTIRLRIWNNPNSQFCSVETIKKLATEIKNSGMKVWLSMHYSDTWADPANQIKPAAWSNLSYQNLKDSVYNFTKNIVTQIQPEYIQIGNEINNGFLFPEGSWANELQFIALLQQGVAAVRAASANCKIMLHFAGYENATYFYSKVKNIDYDFIALSYYPLWHGKNLDSLQSNLKKLSTDFNKNILIAETAYPFTLNWSDWTNNILGDNSQILPQFAATPKGQLSFLNTIKSIVKNTPKGIGFCYWGGELVSFAGNTATNGSSWENQALWDFNNTALPALNAFAP